MDPAIRRAILFLLFGLVLGDVLVIFTAVERAEIVFWVDTPPADTEGNPEQSLVVENEYIIPEWLARLFLLESFGYSLVGMVISIPVLPAMWKTMVRLLLVQVRLK